MDSGDLQYLSELVSMTETYHTGGINVGYYSYILHIPFYSDGCSVDLIGNFESILPNICNVVIPTCNYTTVDLMGYIAEPISYSVSNNTVGLIGTFDKIYTPIFSVSYETQGLDTGYTNPSYLVGIIPGVYGSGIAYHYGNWLNTPSNVFEYPDLLTELIINKLMERFSVMPKSNYSVDTIVSILHRLGLR